MITGTLKLWGSVITTLHARIWGMFGIQAHVILTMNTYYEYTPGCQFQSQRGWG
jgi:hypothetical protein